MTVELLTVAITGVVVEAAIGVNEADDAACGEIVAGTGDAHAQGDVEDVNPVIGDRPVGVDTERVHAVVVVGAEKRVLLEKSLHEEVGARLQGSE
jgi:hypothetical protein